MEWENNKENNPPDHQNSDPVDDEMILDGFFFTRDFRPEEQIDDNFLNSILEDIAQDDEDEFEPNPDTDVCQEVEACKVATDSEQMREEESTTSNACASFNLENLPPLLFEDITNSPFSPDAAPLEGKALLDSQDLVHQNCAEKNFPHKERGSQKTCQKQSVFQDFPQCNPDAKILPQEDEVRPDSTQEQGIPENFGVYFYNDHCYTEFSGQPECKSVFLSGSSKYKRNIFQL